MLLFLIYRLVLFRRHGNIPLLTGISSTIVALLSNFAMCFDIFTLSYSLLVEEIDLGDGNVRQVVSGLAKYCNPEDLTVRDWLALLPSFDIYLPVYVPF